LPRAGLFNKSLIFVFGTIIFAGVLKYLYRIFKKLIDDFT